MMRVRLEDLRAGMRLARPVPVPQHPTRYLVQRDVVVTDDIRRRLMEIGVADVWVRCEELGFLEQLIDPELQERQRELYASIRQNFEKINRFPNAQLDFNSFQSSVLSLFDYLHRDLHGLRFLDRVQTYDDYLLSHSANVCYLAMLIGMKLDWYLMEERPNCSRQDAKEVVTLGLGCLLHDVGKLKVSKAILDKPSRLTEAEFAEIKRHPVLGHEMVKGKAPPLAVNVVLHHHQRWDGRGYPGPREIGLPDDTPPFAGKRIHIFSRIATMADVFDAATSKRVYSDAKPPVQALSEILKYNQGCFDPVVQKAFYDIMPPFPLGSLVKLNNGFTAAVVDFNPEFPCRPRVVPILYPEGEPCHYPDNREIDLALEQDLFVQNVGETDVRPYLFGKGTPAAEPLSVACA